MKLGKWDENRVRMSNKGNNQSQNNNANLSQKANSKVRFGQTTTRIIKSMNQYDDLYETEEENEDTNNDQTTKK